MEEKLWFVGILLVLVIVIGIAGTTFYADYKIGEAIKNGANPIEAKYAFRKTSTAEDAMAWFYRQANKPLNSERAIVGSGSGR